MPTSQQHSRVNLAELKAQIRKKIGAQRTENYFGHLGKLFSQKLTKVEFDKLCYLTIGKENIGLHNQLIRSILKNAYQSDVPEPYRVPSKSIKGVLGKPNSSLTGIGGFLPSSSKSDGDPFARSPCKTWSRFPDRKVHDRPSTTTLPSQVNSHRADSSVPQGDMVDLSGPNSKRASSLKTRTLPSATMTLENGHLKAQHLLRPLQLSLASSTVELPEVEALPQSKRPRLESVASPEKVSGDIKVGIEVTDVENEEVVNELDISVDNRLSAPLGIAFRSESIGSTRRSPCSSLPTYDQLAKEQGCLDNSELPATESLHRWMERVAESKGLQGASEDSANLLNHGLDAFLKRLIKSCIDLKGRPGQESVKVGNSQWMPNACIAADEAHIESGRLPFSFLDFKTAMELCPQQLGGHRPLWMEKICSQIL